MDGGNYAERKQKVSKGKVLILDSTLPFVDISDFLPKLSVIALYIEII